MLNENVHADLFLYKYGVGGIRLGWGGQTKNAEYKYVVVMKGNLEKISRYFKENFGK